MAGGACLALLLALMAVYLLREGEPGKEAPPEIRITYVSDVRASLSRNGGGSSPEPVRRAPPLPLAVSSPGPADALLPELARLSADPTAVPELGLPEGDFVWRAGTGWQRYERLPGAAEGRFVIVEWKDLPEEVRRRHPALAPASAHSGAREPGGARVSTPSRSWDLNPELGR